MIWVESATAKHPTIRFAGNGWADATIAKHQQVRRRIWRHNALTSRAVLHKQRSQPREMSMDREGGAEHTEG
jgi:hypothetical protein